MRKKLSLCNNEGQLLLIALILLGTIAISTVYLSLVLLNEIKSTRYADNAIGSYYVGESGLESALWHLKTAKTGDPAFFTDLDGATDQCGADTDPTTGACTDPERLYSFTQITTSGTDVTLYDIPRNSPMYTDVYSPSLEGQTGANTGITQLNVDWYVSGCTSEASAKLEMTYTPINIESLQPSDPKTEIDICGCSSSSEDPDPLATLYKCAVNFDLNSHSLQVGGLSSDSFYRVSFRSADVPIKKLVMTGSNGGTSALLPSQVTIKVTGTYRESQSLATVNAQWRDALSGIFNYVVFSEESLIKDTTSSNAVAYYSQCGICSDEVTKGCSKDADCTAGTCGVGNSAAFCGPESGAGENLPPNMLQTDAGLCNASCNGNTFCGDGTLQSPNGVGDTEICDTGPSNSNTLQNACRTICYPAYCGDNVVDTVSVTSSTNQAALGHAEECDEGSENSDTVSLKCRTSCKNPYCGDGQIDNGDFNGIPYSETCDDGNTSNGDGCSSVCRTEVPAPPECRNGITETDETCDDIPGLCGTYGYCLCDCSNMTPAVCPNGIPELPAEQCDPIPFDTQMCEPNPPISPVNNGPCTKTFCGDGRLENPDGFDTPEVCDDGNTANNDQCNTSCQRTYCGDLIKQQPNGMGQDEGCDFSGCVTGGICVPSAPCQTRCISCVRTYFKQKCNSPNPNGN